MIRCIIVCVRVEVRRVETKEKKREPRIKIIKRQ